LEVITLAKVFRLARPNIVSYAPSYESAMLAILRNPMCMYRLERVFPVCKRRKNIHRSISLLTLVSTFLAAPQHVQV
jgi:hypothetical protein